MPIAALGLNIAWEWTYAVRDLATDAAQLQAWVNLIWPSQMSSSLRHCSGMAAPPLAGPPIVPRVSRGIRTLLVIALATGALYLALSLLLAEPLGLAPNASGFAGCGKWDWEPFPLHMSEVACLQFRRFSLLAVAGGAVVVAWTVWSGRR
jgi:hypothetical protein